MSVFEILFIVFLVLGFIFLGISVALFFVFKIPSVYLLRSGKGARATIKKMEAINAETGRLRKDVLEERESLKRDRNKEKRTTGRIARSGKLNKSNSGSLNKTAPEEDRIYEETLTQNVNADANAQPLQSSTKRIEHNRENDSSQTTVLADRGSVVEDGSQTTLLSSEMPSVTRQGDDVSPVYNYYRQSSGRFNITYDLKYIHSDISL